MSARATWGGIVLLALAAALWPPAAASAFGAYQRAITLEQAGRLAEAAKVLQRAELTPAKKAHADALTGALRALDAADAYERHGEPEAARDALSKAIAKLDPVREVYVAIALRKRLRAAADASSHGLEQEARAMLGRAQDDERQSKLEQAEKEYEAVIGLAKTGLSPVLVDRAHAGELRAKRLEAAVDHHRSHSERFFGWIGAQFAKVGGWLAPVVPILLLVLLALMLTLIPRLRPSGKGQTLINFTDWSADASARAQKSFALARQFKAEVDAATQGSDSSNAEIDETRDLEGAPVPSFRATGDEIGGIDVLLPDDAKFKVGPIEFSLRQLLGLVRAPFRQRPEYELVGSLTAEGKRSIIEADLHSADGRMTRHWQAASDGEESRQKAISELATRVAVEVGRSYISGNWRSVRAYRTAREKLDALDGSTREEDLVAVRDALQRSLGADQHNLLARFYLATVLRSLGDNRSAVKQLDFLDRLLDSRPTLSERTQEFLGRHPEFEALVAYNKAAALAKISDWKCHDRAMSILESLEKRLTAAAREPDTGTAKNGQLGAADARRLLFLVNGAQAAGLVFELEEWVDRKASGSTPLQSRIQAAFGKIKAIRDALDKQAPEGSNEAPTAYVQALAATENAYGRALYLTKKSTNDAAESFDRAVALVPDFADAWLNLASLLVHRRPGNWESRADEASERAVELSPKSSKAHYLRGLVLERTKHDDEAIKEFTAAGADALTTVKIAQIAARKNDFATAVAQMKASLSISPTPDYRAQAYVEFILRLKEPTSAQLDDAEHWARELHERGATERLRQVGAELLGKIDDRRPET